MEKESRNFDKIRNKSLLVHILNFLKLDKFMELSFLCKKFKNATGINKRKIQILNMISSIYHNEKYFKLKFSSMLLNCPSIIVKFIQKKMNCSEKEVEEEIEYFLKYLTETKTFKENVLKKNSFLDQTFLDIYKESDFLYHHMKIWLSQSTLIKNKSLFSFFNKVETLHIDTNFPLLLNVEGLFQYCITIKHLEIVTFIKDNVDLQYLTDYFDKKPNRVERLTLHLDQRDSSCIKTYKYIKQIIIKNSLSLRKIKLNFNTVMYLDCVYYLECCSKLDSLVIRSKKSISDSDEKQLILFLAKFSDLSKIKIGIFHEENLIQAMNLFKEFKNLRNFPFKQNIVKIPQKMFVDYFLKNDSLKDLNLKFNHTLEKEIYIDLFEKLNTKKLEHVIISVSMNSDEKIIHDLLIPLLKSLSCLNSLLSLSIISKSALEKTHVQLIQSILIFNENLKDLNLKIQLPYKNKLEINKDEYYCRISNEYLKNVFEIIEIFSLRTKQKPKSFSIKFHSIDTDTFVSDFFSNKDLYQYVTEIILSSCRTYEKGINEFFTMFNKFNKLEKIHLINPHYIMDNDFIIDLYKFLMINRHSLIELIINLYRNNLNATRFPNRLFYQHFDYLYFPKLRKLEVKGHCPNKSYEETFRSMMTKYSRNFPNLIRYEIS